MINESSVRSELPSAENEFDFKFYLYYIFKKNIYKHNLKNILIRSVCGFI